MGSRSHALRGNGLSRPLCGEERKLHANGATDPTQSVAAMRSPCRAWEREAMTNDKRSYQKSLPDRAPWHGQDDRGSDPGGEAGLELDRCRCRVRGTLW